MSLPSILKISMFYGAVNDIKASADYRQAKSDFDRDISLDYNTDRIVSGMKDIKGGKKSYVDKRKLNVCNCNCCCHKKNKELK